MFPFVLAIPLPILIMVLFRKSLRNLFSPEQHRRLNPFIRTALMAGIILSSYALVGSLLFHLGYTADHGMECDIYRTGYFAAIAAQPDLPLFHPVSACGQALKPASFTIL